MRTPLQFGAALCWCTLLVTGCRMMTGPADFEGNALLKPAQPSPDSVKMEVIWARFPAGDPALNDEAWKEIDETQLDPAAHSQLANNGLRVGVITGKFPEAISRALNQGKGSPDEPSMAMTGETKQLLADPIIRGRVIQMPRDKRHEIMASEVLTTLSLLLNRPEGLSCHTYAQAQAVYAMRVDPQPDRSTLVELTPELHYGPPQLKFTGSEDGLMYQAPMRERKVFDALRMNVKLAPGNMLVIMSLPNSRGQLGHYFHTADSADGPQQKLILIRLAEVPQDHLFASMEE